MLICLYLLRTRITGVLRSLSGILVLTVFTTAVSRVAGVTLTAQGCTGAMVTFYAISSKREGQIVSNH